MARQPLRSLHGSLVLPHPYLLPPTLPANQPMDAERLNQTETRLEDLAHRLEDLRGYL